MRGAGCRNMTRTREMAMRVLTNKFHGTEYHTNKTESQVQAIIDDHNRGVLSSADRAWVRRVRKALCGHDDCCCGVTALRER